MNSNQQSKPTTITCDKCGKIVPRKIAFFMYEFKCCSNECIESFRIKRQAAEAIEEAERERKRPRHGSFVFSHGGAL